MPAIAKGLRPCLRTLATFGAGLAVGWAAWMAVLPTYDDSILSTYRIEQELLADRAAARGDRAEEERHRRNVIASLSREGFETITRDHGDGVIALAALPPALLVFELVKADAAPAEPCCKSLPEALARGRLALAIERAGRADEADAEWTRAFELYGRRDLPSFRKVIESIASVDSAAAQTAVLGPGDDSGAPTAAERR